MLGALLASTAATPAFADITNWNGTGSWSTPGNWSLGIPVPGDEARVQSGTLIVDTSVETLKGWIYGTAQATVQSGWTIGNDFGLENAGTLDVLSGGTMQVGEDLFLQSGTVRVGGANASLAVAADFVVGRGAAPSTIIIENGGQLTTGRSFVGEGHNTVAATGISVRVSGAGSVWNAGSFLAMGGSETMEVQALVENGGQLAAQTGAIGRGGKGALTITGAQSELRVNGTLTVGDYFNGHDGEGTLTIENGAQARIGTLRVADDPGSSGMVTVDNATLYAGQVAAGTGDGAFHLNNNARLVLTGAQSNLFAGFGAGKVSIQNGVIDTQGFNVRTGAAIGGTTLTKTGTGTLTLAGANSFSGDLLVTAGVVAVKEGGTFLGAAGLQVAANAGFTVDGNGSRAAFDTVQIDNGGKLIVSDKASLAAQRLTLGSSGSTLATEVTVTGGASLVASRFLAGENGVVAMLVEDAAVVTLGTGAPADRTVLTSDGSRESGIVMTGAQTRLNVLGDFYVGEGLGRAAVAVSDGAVLETTGTTYLANSTGSGLSYGAVNLSDGEWRAADVVMGVNVGSSASVTLDGPDARLQVDGTLTAGVNGGVAGLQLIKGTADIDRLVLAGENSSASVLHYGTDLTVREYLGGVGENATSLHYMTVAAPKLTAETLKLGVAKNAQGLLALVDTGAVATVTGQAVVGELGYGGLYVYDDSRFEAGSLHAALDAASTGYIEVKASTLTVGQIAAGDGQATFQLLDKARLVLSASQADLFANFGSDDAVFVSDGIIDTQGFDVRTGAVISGADMTKAGSGRLTLAADNTLGGVVRIEAGTLQLGDGGTSGMIGASVINDGVLAFNRSDDVDFGTVISGTGAVHQIGKGTVILSGDNSYAGGTVIRGGTLAVSQDANLGAAAGKITFEGGTLRTTADFASGRDLVFAGDGTVLTDAGTTLTLSSTLSGSGGFTKAGSGRLVLTADNGAYTATTRVNEGTLSVNGVLGSHVDVAQQGRLGGNGRVGSVFNTGTVAPGNSFGTLTVVGNYVGNGGVLEIETALGGDDSATDRLVVLGDTAGQTEVVVLNRDGLGGVTVEGIKIIDVAGASNGTFVLRGDYVFEGDPAVIGGAYAYRLFKGGISDPTDGDWYLRTTLEDDGDDGDDATPQPQPQPQPGPQPGPQPAPSPAPSPATGEVGVVYQPGVPVYEGYVQTLLALSELPTMQERVGNRTWAGSPIHAGSGIWGRIRSTRHRPEAAFSTSGTDKNINSWQMQLGMEQTLAQRSDGSTLIGAVTAHYGKADGHVASRFGRGAIKTKGHGLGATLTWHSPSGFYADGQAQVSWFSSDLTSGTLGALTKDNDGTGVGFSLELGKRASLGGGLSLTPQIQVSYAHADFDRFVDPAGAVVKADQAESLRTRWGLSLDHQATVGANRSRYLYGIVNISREWLAETGVMVSGTDILNRERAWWGEIGLGGSYTWNGRVTLYAQGSGKTALGDFGDSYSLKGTVGLRASF